MLYFYINNFARELFALMMIGKIAGSSRFQSERYVHTLT